MAIRVMLVDDHPLITEGLISCLERWEQIEVCGSASSAEQAFELIAKDLPDVLLMDLNMPDQNGLTATRKLTQMYPDLRIILLTMHNDRGYVLSAIQNGAHGYILKDVSSQEVVAAIEAVASGGSFFSPSITRQLADPQCAGSSALTPREREVLTAVAQGQSSKQIAYQLELSERTVETHRKHIKKKLGIDTTAGLTRYAIDNQLLS